MYTRRVRAPLTAASLLAPLLLACGDRPEPPKKIPPRVEATPATDPAAARRLPSGVRYELGNERKHSCVRTVCVGGPGELTDEANRDLGELCRRAPGIVRRCEGAECASVWTVAQWPEAVDALASSLDVDLDGDIDADDPRCTIHLAGWSTGATIVSEALPDSFARHPRVPRDRARIGNLVAIAPWAEGRPALKVDPRIAKAFVYRHTLTPEHDCSRAYPGGPWLSPTPVCGPKTQCWDYDYSLEPTLAYVGRRGARSGAEVGHCSVVSLVAHIGLDNLTRGQEALTQMVPHYSNGEHGGRVHQGPAKPDPIELLDNPHQPD